MVPFSAPFEAEAVVNIVPRLAISADTWALQSICNQEGRSALDLLTKSFYPQDEYDVGGMSEDLPELEIDLSLSSKLGAHVDLTPEDRSNLGTITTLLLDAYNVLPS